MTDQPNMDLLPRSARSPSPSRLRSIARSSTLKVVWRRLLTAIPVLFGVSFVTFALLNLLPGDTVTALLGSDATPAEVKALTLKLHFNESFIIRYGHWLANIVRGDFGVSLASGQPVSSILRQRLPVSLELIAFAFIIAIVLAVPVATLAAFRPKSFVDRSSILVSMVGLSVPNFVFGLVLILIFAVHLGLVPVLGFVPISQSIGGNFQSLVLPAFTIAFGLFCSYSRVLRADIAEQMLAEDYIVTARAKGVRPSMIILRHALPNSLFGLLTLVGLNIGTLVGGTVIVEEIFSLPGMGQELLQSITNRDVIVVEGEVIVFALLVVAANLITDLLYAVLDPRIRYGRRTA
jgi:peptide/nickel transport system permease protein